MIEWRDIEGYEGFYQISNTGEVRSVDRHHLTRGRFGIMNRKAKSRIIKKNKRSTGYWSVELNKNRDVKRVNIHRLVYAAFNGFYDVNNMVHHKDGNKLNNSIENLEEISVFDHNAEHSGVKNTRQHNSGHTYVVCVNTGAVYFSISDVARFYDCCYETVLRHVLSGRKTIRGFTFKYAI